jgi:hypothetical protein
MGGTFPKIQFFLKWNVLVLQTLLLVARLIVENPSIHSMFCSANMTAALFGQNLAFGTYV